MTRCKIHQRWLLRRHHGLDDSRSLSGAFARLGIRRVGALGDAVMLIGTPAAAWPCFWVGSIESLTTGTESETVPEKSKMSGRGAIVVKSAVVTCGVGVLYATIFVVQLLFGVGPVGATLRMPGGSPGWFEAAANWVRFDAFFIWPLVIAIGAVAQRLWCRRSRLGTVVFVAVPGILTTLGRGTGRGVALTCLYLATAVAVGALASRLFDGGRRDGLQLR